MAEILRKKLMTYYDDSVLNNSDDNDTELFFRKFIKYPDEIIIFDDDMCFNGNEDLRSSMCGFSRIQTIIYPIYKKYLVLDLNIGSCEGCDVSICQKIQKNTCKKVIQEIVDNMKYYTDKNDIIKDYKSRLQQSIAGEDLDVSESQLTALVKRLEIKLQ
jgi:hypothetical protein